MGSLTYLKKYLYSEVLKTANDPKRILGILEKDKRKDYLCKLKLVFNILTPWSDMSPEQIVSSGYDQIAEIYTDWTQEVQKEQRDKYIDVLLKELPSRAEVLDLGCGAGIPATNDLAKHFVVTGIDISARMIALARDNVPSAKFIQADMTEIDFMPNSYDAVVSFYSMIHVPRDKQQRLLYNIASWLRPGGILVATMGVNSVQMILEKDWMGVPMFWSIYDTETNLRLIRKAGLEVMSRKKITENVLGKTVTFLWMTAKKPSKGGENESD
jgi:SAM-dependent methyltransferase